MLLGPHSEDRYSYFDIMTHTRYSSELPGDCTLYRLEVSVNSMPGEQVSHDP